MQEHFAAIRFKLEQMAAVDPALLVIDSDFKLAPPLDEREVSAWEARNGVRLPEDYRAFLLGLGSAGAGPGYGLEPLGTLRRGQTEANASPKTPFPLREFFDVMDNPDGLSETELNSDKWTTGAIYLGTEGCGMDYLLVVAGDERGHVWMDDRTNGYGIYPVAPNREELGGTCEDTTIFVPAESKHERTAFLNWYEWWLDWMIEEVKSVPED